MTIINEQQKLLDIPFGLCNFHSTLHQAGRLIYIMCFVLAKKKMYYPKVFLGGA